MLTALAFVVALALLIAVHEYGHYRMALACGVKVLRFSIGFGPPVLRWKQGQEATEFVMGLLPLGGYVRMLDEREGAVDPAQRHRAFNTQPLRSRAAIVAAGPLANLVLAVLLYAAVHWIGVEEPQAILSTPIAGSIAQRSGLRGGEVVQEIAIGAAQAEPVRSFEDLRWTLARAALDGENVRLTLEPTAGAHPREWVLETSRIEASEADAQLLRKIGIVGPWTRPVLGDIMPEGAAQRAGLREGDLVLKINHTDIVDGAQLRQWIRDSVPPHSPNGSAQTWHIQRQGQSMTVQVAPEVHHEPQGAVGRINAYIGAPPPMVHVRYDAIEGLWRATVRTWEISSLTLRTMGRMLVGEASLKNLSGPLTIADYAGRSASMGLTQYLAFLALISVSLGVLNLLPLPVLDGGHLLYYLWEAVTGKAVSDAWMQWLQRAGVVLLMLMMSIALFNDVTRFFG